MSPLGDVYEKSAGAWVKRANIAGPAGPSAYPLVGGNLLGYKRMGFSGQSTAQNGAPLIAPISFTMRGSILVVYLQQILHSAGNVRAWLRLDGADVPGRFFYYPGYGSPQLENGLVVKTNMTPGAHSIEPWWASSNTVQWYDDGPPVNSGGAGDSNVSFYMAFELGV